MRRTELKAYERRMQPSPPLFLRFLLTRDTHGLLQPRIRQGQDLLIGPAVPLA